MGMGRVGNPPRGYWVARDLPTTGLFERGGVIVDMIETGRLMTDMEGKPEPDKGLRVVVVGRARLVLWSLGCQM
jgi:hypothetical protein